MNFSFYETYQKEVKKNCLCRLIFTCFNFLFRLNSTIKRSILFDQEIKKLGISQASANFLDFLKIRLQVTGRTKLEKNTGYLFFGNHPTLIDPIAMMTVIADDQMKFFSGANVLKIGPNLARHIFPIKNMQEKNGKKRKEILIDWIYTLFFKSLVEYWEREKAIKHNRFQVEKAADFLASGGRFLIFPILDFSGKRRFQKGIGFILSKARQKNKERKIKIVPFFVGIKYANLFTLLTLFKYRKPINLEIVLADPIDFSQYQKLIKKPKELALVIEADYLKFIKGFS
jgi:hypothetical protein